MLKKQVLMKIINILVNESHIKKTLYMFKNLDYLYSVLIIYLRKIF